MKRINSIGSIFALGVIQLAAQSINTAHDDFVVTLESTWHCLDDNDSSCSQFGGKWMLVGNITFRKKSIQDSIHLRQLKLHWDGPFIDSLSASLYKKNFDPTKKEFLPIDDYLICDGCWNSTKQTLIMSFDERQALGAIEVFYIVLTVPTPLEIILKQGSFSLVKNDLPLPFQQAYTPQSLQLNFNTLT
jgi:hypothetical protein